MRLSVLFVISLRLVVFSAAFPCAEVCIVSCCVPACAQSWCFGLRLLVRSFSPQAFCYSFHCWHSCWFWAFPRQFRVFPHSFFCWIIVLVALLVCAFPHRAFCWMIVSVALLVCDFPTWVFKVLLCQFSAIDLLSPCLVFRPVGFCWLLFWDFPYQGFC